MLVRYAQTFSIPKSFSSRGKILTWALSWDYGEGHFSHSRPLCPSCFMLRGGIFLKAVQEKNTCEGHKSKRKAHYQNETEMENYRSFPPPHLVPTPMGFLLIKDETSIRHTLSAEGYAGKPEFQQTNKIKGLEKFEICGPYSLSKYETNLRSQ